MPIARALPINHSSSPG